MTENETKNLKVLCAMNSMNKTLSTWCEDCKKGAAAAGAMNEDDECPWDCKECLGWVKEYIEIVSDRVKEIISGRESR